MPTRTLLCVEPHDRDADIIRAELSFAFDVRNMASAEEAVAWAKANPPALIMVSVEPNKVGYAVCNKIKRSAELKHIPVILISADETEETFDQHRKLKARADAYILKPLSKEELLDKVGKLVGLDAVEAKGSKGKDDEDDDILLTSDLEEIAIAEDDIVEEEISQPTPVPVTTSSSRPFGGPDLDSLFDQETEAAFAAIQAANSDTTGPLMVPPTLDSGHGSPWSPESSKEESWDADAAPTGISAGNPFSFQTHEPSGSVDLFPQSSAAAVAEEAQERKDDDAPGNGSHPNAARSMFGANDTPPSPDEVMPPMSIGESVPMSVGAGNDLITELRTRLHELESEKQRLASDLEEARGRLQSQPLTKDREMLNLREAINRKEKDLLDLRDSLDARERQLLDQKDRMRELDRARRDLEESTLVIEKNLVSANERMAALTQDKDKAIEREKGLKARLDSALSEIQKAYDETDLLKKKMTSLVEELATERQDRKNEVSALKRQYDEELATAEERRLRELAEADTRRIADLEGADGRRRAEIQARDEQHHAAIADADRRHLAEKTEAAERVRNDLEEAFAKAALAQSELAAGQDALGELNRRLEVRESELHSVQADLRDREVKLAQSRDRVGELESKSTELEEQVLRAYQKLRNDEKVMDKAKRALAVALTLLDGNDPAPPPPRSSEESQT
jgi:CheY-like chemotaxis protein